MTRRRKVYFACDDCVSSTPASALSTTNEPSLATLSTTSSAFFASIEASTLSKNHSDTSGMSESCADESICDYDENITKIYQFLEDSEWEAAVERCKAHPLEVQTWVVRYQTNSRRIRWKLLPLHAAVIFSSPEFVVSSLLEQYPEAAAQTDDIGMTPLHLAFRHSQDDENVLRLLLEAYPEAVFAKDYRGRSPIGIGMKRRGKYSASLMHLYANTCMRATLMTQETIESVIDEISGSTVNKALKLNKPPSDELADFEQDEILQLERGEKKVGEGIEKSYDVVHISQERDIEEPEVDRCVGAEKKNIETNEDTQDGQSCREHAEDDVEYREDDITMLTQNRNDLDDRDVCEQVAEELEVDEIAPLTTEPIKLEHDEPNDKALLKTNIAQSTTIDMIEQTMEELEQEDTDLDDFCSAMEETSLELDVLQPLSLRESDTIVPSVHDIVKLQQRHATEISNLRNFYEERLQAMVDETMKNLGELHQECDAAGRAVREQHYQNMERIKNYIVEEEKKNAEVRAQLQDEIGELKLAVAKERDAQVCRENIMHDVQAIQEDQIKLQRLIRDQQNELDRAQKVRAVIIKTLLEQDDEEGAIRNEVNDAIMNLAENIQSRLEILAPAVPMNNAEVIKECLTKGKYRYDDISTITDHFSNITTGNLSTGAEGE